MHSYADRRTHDFFFERDYPDVKVLDAIFARLRAEPVEKAALQHQLRMDAETSSTKRSRSSGFTAARWWISPRTSAAATTIGANPISRRAIRSSSSST